jgi:hypothetical protein
VRASVADIPGETITSGNFVGLVGGDIVDAVYRIRVPDSSLLIVSITGGTGAELGIYLFDQAATSILTDTPFTSSAKPGGIQSVSTQFKSGQTVFIDVNGRNVDRSFQFRLSVVVLVDSTPPVIRSVVFDAVSRSEHLCAYVDAVDIISGFQEIAFSEVSGGELFWETYSGSERYCTSVNPGEGSRSISVLVRNGIGLVAMRTKLSVVVDDTPPELIGALPVGDNLYLGLTPITWVFSERIRPVGSLKTALVVVDQNSNRLAGTATLSKSRKKITWMPSTVRPAGSIVILSLSSVADDAGNQTDLLSTLMYTRKNRTAIRVSAASSDATHVRLQITGSANLVGKTVMIQVKDARGWGDVRVVVLKNRSTSVRIPRVLGDKVRIVWVGSERLAPSISAPALLPR